MAASILRLAVLGAFFSAFLVRESLEADTPLSFSFESFGKNRSFESEIGLFGDAGIGDSGVRVTRSVISSSGRVVYRNPIRFTGTNPGFSTYFAFSVSSGNGGGFAFFATPSSVQMDSLDGFRLGLPPSVVAVGFFTSSDPKRGNLSGSHIEVDVGSELSIKSSDLSRNNSVLNSGEELHSWIDYNGTSNRLEVRLSKSRVPIPKNPLLSYPINLSNVLWREKILVGLSSSSGNSSQNSSLYSWTFAVTHGAPYPMHSQPLDPNSFLERPRESPPAHLRRNYPWGILMALVFAAACGAMVAFFTLFVWFAVVAHRSIAPVEYPMHPSEVVYEKIVIVAATAAANAK
ncbi:L-type lectin-domain containing receptor kinase VIII.1-like [Typha latifolia]|uniref:L-type lectin-domain containing receptor kinase VIII.1-like n=1 Tax=Typha latifolia TaxID=4733 RepID=UPI003C308C76